MNLLFGLRISSFPLVAILSVQSLDATPKPSGVFSSAGASDVSVHDHSEVRGVLIRAPWYALERTPGVFDFGVIDAQVSAAKAGGSQWSLGILAGGVGSPDWLIDDLEAPYIDYSFRGTPGYRLPLFWNETVLARLRILADAVAGAYGNDPDLALVYVPQMTSNGIEGHLQGVSLSDLESSGYTDELWIEASKSATRSFAAAFLRKPVAFEVHEIGNDPSIPSRIINDLWNEPGLEKRVGAAMWWLSGSTDYQPGLLEVLGEFPGDIYAQVIGRSDQTTRFTAAGYAAVFDQAKELGIRYIEPWEYEFQTGPGSADGMWDDRFADFNEWADANHPADPQLTGRLGPPSVMPDSGHATVRWLAISGVAYTVFRSTNLIDWTPMARTTATSSDWQAVSDPAELDHPGNSSVFYQVAQEPAE